MTADQRLIVRIEQVAAAVEGDRLIAAYHMLEELLRELDAPLKAPVESRPAARRRSTPPAPLAAAG